jgi:plastocyanin
VRRALVGLAAAALAAAAGTSTAISQDHAHEEPAANEISMQFAAFAPAQRDVLAGATVRWMNDSLRAHDIVARDGSFDSGRIPAGEMFEHRFDADGSFAYVCSIHLNMTGTIDVHPVLLDRPAEPGAPNRPYVLVGRSAVAGRDSVDIEGDDGGGSRHVATAEVGAGGAFRATVVPRTSTTYRAVAGDMASPAVPLIVVDRTIAVASARHGAATRVAVRVAPAAMHERVALQLRLPEHFGWWTVRRARLDHESRARFTLRPPRAARARVVLTLADGWTVVARSPAFRVRAG